MPFIDVTVPGPGAILTSPNSNDGKTCDARAVHRPKQDARNVWIVAGRCF